MSRDRPSKLYQRGRFGFAPRLGEDKQGVRKGPGGLPLPPLLRSRPRSGRETGEKRKEAAAPLISPALLCPGSPQMEQVRDWGLPSPRGGDGGGPPRCGGRGLCLGGGDGRDGLQEQGFGGLLGEEERGRTLSPESLFQGKGLLPAPQQSPP